MPRVPPRRRARLTRTNRLTERENGRTPFDVANPALAGWLLGVMLSVAPPGQSKSPPEAVESESDGRARYADIANALAEVVLDADEKPVFAGNRGRERTAALLLAISHHESGFRRDVDLGLGRGAHGGGPYHCMMQVSVKGRTPEGWTGADLTSDRRRCFRAGLHLVQRAHGACQAEGPDAWLRLYTGGTCDRGAKAADERMTTFHKWLERYPFPVETR